MFTFLYTENTNNQKKKEDKGVRNSDYTPSEGEAFIADYFDKESIKYVQEKPIVGLYNDTKQYRRADFYLKDYDVYLEFLGRWNNTSKDRETYRHKKKVFKHNNIPCVYLYPENLGIIEFSFQKRLIAVLKEHNKNKELLRFKLAYVWKHNQERTVYIFLALLVLFVLSDGEPFPIICALVAILYQLYQASIFWKRINRF